MDELLEFNDFPNTETPINAENLNKNFSCLKRINEATNEDITEIGNGLSKVGVNLTTLYNGERQATSSNSNITVDLSDDVTKYDLLLVVTRGDYNHYKTTIILPTLPFKQDVSVASTQSYYSYGYIDLVSNTSLELTLTESKGWDFLYISKVYGIKIKGE